MDSIELWIHDIDKPTIYWLNGLAGTGKSTIAQTTAERAFADGRLGASFFCSRDFQDRRDLRSIFPTLAVQLSRRYPEFRSAFVKLIRSNPDIVHESLYNQMEKLIVQPLAKCTISTVIVIDALDECQDEEPASAILSVLGQFVADIPTIKFFITGRPESRIQEGFRLPLLAEATDVFVLHEVEPNQVTNDVRLFFRHSFAELKRHRRGLDNWPTEEQVDILCERAGGLFVHAMATVRFIGERNNSPKKQLDRLLQSQGSSVFEGRTRLKTNATLDLLYTSILQEAFGADHPENDPRVRSVLGAVVLAANPLSPSAVAALLGFESEEVLPLLSSLHSLLVFQEDIDLPVRPFHKSFPDFIVDPDRCTNPRFRVCPLDHHTELLSGCLETMNRELKRNMCNLPDGVVNSEVIDLKERVEDHIGQALKYACESWYKHLVGTIPAGIIPVLHRFLEEKFLFWLEALSVLGAAREAVDALGVVAKCEWTGVCCISLVVYLRFTWLESGSTNSRPCQRVLAFRICLLRGHQRVRTAYIPFCPHPIALNVDYTRAVWTVCQPLCEGREGAIAFVGSSCCHHLPWLITGRGRMVAVRQIHRSGCGGICRASRCSDSQPTCHLQAFHKIFPSQLLSRWLFLNTMRWPRVHQLGHSDGWSPE